MEEQTTNNPLSDLEISEILGEASSEAGVYANVVDTSCEVVEPLAIPENVENNASNWEGYHPVIDTAFGESHTDTIVSSDILDDVEEIIESQQEPDDSELLKELNSMQTLRFKGASWFVNMEKAEVIVAGVGGIGRII